MLSKMLCKDCKKKPTVRGMKKIRCVVCNKETIVNSDWYSYICVDCSDETGCCAYCGEFRKNGSEVVRL